MKPNPFQALPHGVDINGVLYPIDSDFRVGITIETELLEQKPDIEGLLTLFYKGNIPANLSAAADKMLWFYMYKDRGEEEKEGESKHGKRCYDFIQDADALLASFMDAYNVDLSTASLHWWTFRRLMVNIPPDTPIAQRIRYRTADLSKMGKQEKKHYKKMRKLYALKQPDKGPSMTVEERDQALKEKIRLRFEEASRQAKK